MRLRELHLELFGHFEDAHFDFGQKTSSKNIDFHVIYGPNEAGKSTLMEGYLRLLYGFPKREQYAFMHDRKNLSVAGVIEDGDEELFVKRVPTNNPSLRDANGAPLLENVIQAHLNGLPLDDYRKLLCLNDDTIAAGGEEIIHAKGEVGRLLFSSASGISDLSSVLDSIKENADELYKKRGSTSAFAVLKRDVRSIEERIKQIEVTQSEFKHLKQEYNSATKVEKEVTEKRKQLLQQREQLRSRIEVIPLISEYNELDEKLAPFAEWPSRVDLSAETLVDKLTEFRKAEADSQRLATEVKNLTVELEKVIVNPSHIGLRNELDELNTLKSRYVTADEDLVRRRNEREKLGSEIKSLLMKLGLGEETSFSEVVLDPNDLKRLEKIKAQMEAASLKLKTEEEECEKVVAKFTETKEFIKIHKKNPPKGLGLIENFEKFNVEKLMAKFASASEAIDSAEQLAKKTKDALNIKGVQFESTPSCTTTIEEVEEFLENQKNLSSDLKADKEELEKIEIEISRTGEQISLLTQSDGVLSNDEFASLFGNRNKLWEEHKENMTSSSAKKFEKLMFDVDTASKNRQSNSETLGQLTQLQLNMTSQKTKKKQLEERIKFNTEALKEFDTKFIAIAKECQLPDDTRPVAIISWLKKLDEATLANDELIRQQEKHQETFKQTEKLKGLLLKHFSDSALDLEGLVDKAKQGRDKLRDFEERTRALQTKLEEQEIELKSRKNSLIKFSDANSEAIMNWKNAISALLPSKIDIVQLEQSLVVLNEIMGKYGSYSELNHRIETMEEDQRNFKTQVEALIKREAIKSSGNILDSFATLVEIADQAESSKKRQLELEKQIESNQKKLDLATQTIETVNQLVSDYGPQFPIDPPINSLEELRETTKKAEEILVERTQLASLKRNILSTLEVESIEAAHELLEGQSVNDLNVRYSEVKSEIDAVETQYKVAIAHKSAAETNLSKISDDAEVASLTEQKTTLDYEKRQVVIRHLKLHLGHKIAEEAIRRYRDTHRNEMLKTTEQAFIELTNNAYKSLQVQPDGPSESLVAIDTTGRSKRADDLSKGTRFQLYLALRAAAYSQLVEQGTSLPFFCDDVFETFDENRTQAACKLMNRVGKQGQAIYLTHHQHVVDIAQETCGKNVKIHQL